MKSLKRPHDCQFWITSVQIYNGCPILETWILWTLFCIMMCHMLYSTCVARAIDNNFLFQLHSVQSFTAHLAVCSFALLPTYTGVCLVHAPGCFIAVVKRMKSDLGCYTLFSKPLAAKFINHPNGCIIFSESPPRNGFKIPSASDSDNAPFFGLRAWAQPSSMSAPKLWFL